MPQRILVLGQAKTGTTGLFYAIKRALPSDAAGYFETPADKLDLSPPHLVAKLLCGPGANPPLDLIRRFDKAVALTRDPRDRLISLFLFRSTRLDHLRTRADREAFVALLREKEADPAALGFAEMLRRARTLGCPDYLVVMRQHASDYAAFLASLGGSAYRQTYESMVRGDIAGLSAWLGLPLEPLGDPDQQFRHVARTRGSGGWRRWFTPADVEELASGMTPCLADLGYPADDWALDPGPLPASTGSDYVRRLFAVRDGEDRFERAQQAEKRNDAAE